MHNQGPDMYDLDDYQAQLLQRLHAQREGDQSCQQTHAHTSDAQPHHRESTRLPST